MQKHWDFLRKILSSVLQFCFVPPFCFARTLPKACGISCVSRDQKLPRPATLTLPVASEGCVRKHGSKGTGKGYSHPSVWSAVTSPSPEVPASLVELTVALMNVLLWLHVITFKIWKQPVAIAVCSKINWERRHFIHISSWGNKEECLNISQLHK